MGKNLKLYIDYDFPNWNEYINLERKNKYAANRLKQKEKKIVECYADNQRYDGKYPIEILFKVHFKNRRRDLDNTRVKGLLDGLVACKFIDNDNLNCIQRIVLKPVFDSNKGIEVEIKEIENEI